MLEGYYIITSCHDLLCAFTCVYPFIVIPNSESPCQLVHWQKPDATGVSQEQVPGTMCAKAGNHSKVSELGKVLVSLRKRVC